MALLILSIPFLFLGVVCGLWWAVEGYEKRHRQDHYYYTYE